jgi:hypothetical protein
MLDLDPLIRNSLVNYKSETAGTFKDFETALTRAREIYKKAPAEAEFRPRVVEYGRHPQNWGCEQTIGQVRETGREGFGPL